VARRATRHRRERVRISDAVSAAVFGFAGLMVLAAFLHPLARRGAWACRTGCCSTISRPSS
jgi:hypothetical protein